MNIRENIEFLVGEEKRLIDVLTEADVMPLLQSAVRSGVECAEILDDLDVCLWRSGDLTTASHWSAVGQGYARSIPLVLEGEPVGQIRLAAPGLEPEILRSTTEVVGGALNALLTGNLKRMLTTEIHTTVVNQSYEELLEANQRLSESEKKYRDLAENLEIRVQQRTEELKQMYTRMIQQEKMASIGQMAAGVAHEINNPLGFIRSNLGALQKYVLRYQEMLACYRRGLGKSDPVKLKEEAELLFKSLKLDFVAEDMEDLFEESIHGADRVKKIVADLKGFSHVDALGEQQLDIHEEIERTLGVLTHEIPEGTKIERNPGQLPEFTCTGGLLGQVLMNVLRNAFQSRKENLEVEITTCWDKGHFEIHVADNGPGIPADDRTRVFEPFFTTREVGAGIGLGLTVVYDVLRNWGGEVEVSDAPSGGACLSLRFPQKVVTDG